MPLPTYRSFIGLSKDSVSTTTSAAVAVGATSLPIVGTGVAAGSTVYIWDGGSSEVRAVTAGGGTSTLTVAALTYAHPANTLITAAPTAAGPTDYVPVTSIDVEDIYDDLEDKGFRGSAVETYGMVQGPAHSEITVNGDAFADTIGYWLAGVLGATDFSAGSPNTHTFSVKNTGDGQPTAFTIYDYDVVNTRAFPSSRVASVALTFDGEGLLTYSTKLVGFASGVVTTPTTSYSTLSPMAVWTGLATIGGTVNPTLISGDMTIQRPVTAIQTLDSTQHPYKIFAGQVSVDGRLTFVMEDDAQLLNMINNTQPSLDITFTTGTGAAQQQIGLRCTKAAYTAAKPARGQDYVQVEVNYKGIATTTDATTAGTGFSPVRVTLKNTKATGTYL